jgi:hypothetical protein
MTTIRHIGVLTGGGDCPGMAICLVETRTRRASEPRRPTATAAGVAVCAGPDA